MFDSAAASSRSFFQLLQPLASLNFQTPLYLLIAGHNVQEHVLEDVLEHYVQEHYVMEHYVQEHGLEDVLEHYVREHFVRQSTC